MSLPVLCILCGAAAALLIIECTGVRVTLSLEARGDIKRETRWFAQYGQAACTIVAALLVWRLDPRRQPCCRWNLSPAVMVLVGTFGTALLCWCLKRLLGRVRPGRADAGKFLGPSLEHHNWRESFPSLHSASAVALSTLLARLYPPVAWLFWGLASVCCLLRYVQDAHWPSDVVGGAALGYGLGSWAWAYWGGWAAA